MPLLTPHEVSKDLQVPEATRAQGRHQGRGPGYLKVGRHVRYEGEAIEAWKSEQTVTPGAQR